MDGCPLVVAGGAALPRRAKTNDAGVPLTWLAEELELGDVGQTSLYMALRPYRASKKFTE